jgi:hypothetical protein
MLNFIKSNHSKGDCIAYDLESIRIKNVLGERRNLLSYYLIDYDFGRMSIDNWFKNCKGLFITQRSDYSLPDNAVLIALGYNSGIKIISRQDDASRINFTFLNVNEYYHNRSDGLPSCLLNSCIKMDHILLNKFALVGDLQEDGLNSKGVGYLHVGPYFRLLPGVYEVIYEYDSEVDSKIVFDVVSSGANIVHYRNNVDVKKGISDFRIIFKLNESIDDIELRTYLPNSIKFKVKNIDVQMK